MIVMSFNEFFLAGNRQIFFVFHFKYLCKHTFLLFLFSGELDTKLHFGKLIIVVIIDPTSVGVQFFISQNIFILFAIILNGNKSKWNSTQCHIAFLFFPSKFRINSNHRNRLHALHNQTINRKVKNKMNWVFVRMKQS